MSRFIDNGNDTITDTSTGLVWSKKTLAVDVRHVNAEQVAAEFCAGYRLPTVTELFGLVDHTKHGPAIDPVFECENDCYWTATPCNWNSSAVWVVNFGDGNVSLYGRSRYACVRAVRSSQ